MKETQYCPCCDEDVAFNQIKHDDLIEFTCIYCGFPLSLEEMSPLSGEAITEPPSKEKIFKRVLAADDSRFTRKIIHDLLIEEKLADDVLTYENGLELTTAYTKLLEEKTPVDIAIIDINMPVMDGIAAAQTIRDIETKNRLSPVPIIFFSAVKADSELLTKMQELSPANYVNKGSDPDPDKLADRIRQIFLHLKKTNRP
jgi:CheY-like chemotaxis protein